MPNYISKNAIQNIPVKSQQIQGDDNGQTGKLKNPLLSSSNYLVGLAKNDTHYQALRAGMSKEPVKLIKIALNTLDELNSIYPGLVLSTKLNTSYDFDSQMEDAVKLYQLWAGLPVTGIVDRETLLSIDSKFFGDEFYDPQYNKFVGKAGKSQIKAVSGIDSEGKYTYQIYVSDDTEPIDIKTNSPIIGTPVDINNKYVDNNKVYIVPQSASKSDIIDNNPEIKQALSIPRLDKSANTLDGIAIGFDASKTKTQFEQKSGEPLYQNFISVGNEMENTPPELFDDPEGKLYKVQEGDSFSDIVLENYYGTGAYNIMDPYNNTVIYQLPNRTPFPVDKRSEDARFQFYLNLIYYCNTEEVAGQPIKEWGMKKGPGYKRYDIDHLDSVNIYDNTFDNNDPGTLTGLPNYYRFLKKMEEIDEDTKIQFDAEGNTPSFIPNPGKNIRIPSRKFADSMYNMLNFRHDEMLQEVEVPPQNPGDDPTYTMAYVTTQVLFDKINDMTSTSVFDFIIDEIKEEAVELYNEVFDYMHSAYEFVISIISAWPRGVGGIIEKEMSITWGIPIETGLVFSENIWREMSQKDELIIKYNKKFELKIGTEVVTGARGMLYLGRGTSRRKLGINYGAGVSGSQSFIASMEYEFPIRRDETSLLTMLIMVFGGTLVKSTAEILKQLDIINLDPRQYLSKFEVALEGERSAWAAASIGISPDGQSTHGDLRFDAVPGVGNGVDSDQDQQARGSFGYIDNILKNIPGIEANAQLSGGVAFSYEVAYDNNAKITKGAYESRVFSSLDMEIKVYARAKFNTGLLGSFFQKLFFKFVMSSNPFFNLLNANFDKGFELGVQWHYERKDKAENIELGDINILETPPLISVLSNGNIQFDTPGSDRVIKQMGLFFSTYSGDVDTLCEPGTHAKLLLNAGRIYDLWVNDTEIPFTLTNALLLIREFEFKKKIGFFDYNGKDSTKKLIPKNKVIPDNELTDKTVKIYEFGSIGSLEVEAINFVLSNVANFNDYLFAGFGGLALNLTTKLVMSEILLVAKFYIKKLYYKYTILSPGENRKTFENDLKKHIVKINKNIILKGLNDNPTTAVKGIDLYNMIYSESTLYPATSYKVDGLNKYIDTLILINAGQQDNNNPQEFIDSRDYLRAFTRYITSYQFFNMLLQNITLEDFINLDFGIEDTIDAFSFLTSELHFEATLEGKLGFDIGGEVLVGEGFTAKAALRGMAEINYQAIIYQDGGYTDLPLSDSLRWVFDQIKKIFELPGSDGRIGVKSVLPILK